MDRQVVNFGKITVAYVTERRDGVEAVSCATVKGMMTEQQWQKLERDLTFDAPEAE